MPHPVVERCADLPVGGRLASLAHVIRVLLLLFGLATLCACATTKPWEREALAQPEMAPDDDPDRAALRGHYRSTREGAVGGFGGGGGGCGCN